jgi:pimeloyl-ACP methyl ester carboxylesterase
LSLVDEFAFFVGRVRSTAGAWDEGEGAPVVLLHGIAGGRRSFFRLVPLLAKRRRVVVPLLRGEERPEPRATMDDLLDQLAGLLERLDLKGVTLLGTSFGGFLALAYTARHDPRVEAVVVQGAFARYHLRPLDRVALRVSHLVPARLGSAYFARRVLRGRETRQIREFAPGLETLVVDWSAKTPFASLRRRTRLIAQSTVTIDHDLPLTIAHGELDSVVPLANFEYLRMARPDARAVLWEEVAHMVPLTHPELLAELVP